MGDDALEDAIQSKFELLQSTTAHINHLNDVIKFLSHLLFANNGANLSPELYERYLNPVQSRTKSTKPKRPEGLTNISLNLNRSGTKSPMKCTEGRLLSPTPDGYLREHAFFSDVEEKMDMEEFESQILLYKSQIADLETLVAIERTDTIKHRKLLKKTKKQMNQKNLEIQRKSKELEDLRTSEGENSALIEQMRSRLQIFNNEKKQFEKTVNKMTHEIAGLKSRLRRTRRESQEIHLGDSEETKRKLQQVEIEKSRLEAQINDNETTVAGLKAQISQLEFDLTHEVKSKEIVESELKQIDLQLQQSKRDLEELRIQYDEKEKKSIKDTAAILRQNIGKVRDMMSSVEEADVDLVTQSLVQQCEQMEKVAAKKERLATIEREEAARVIGELVSENEQINAKIMKHMKTLEQNKEQAFREVKNLMEENEELKKSNVSLIEEKNNLEHELRERNMELDELREGNHRLAKDVGELQRFEIVAEELKLQLEQEKAAVEMQMIELTTLNEENMKFHQEVSRYKIDLQETKFKASEVEKQFQEKLEELSALKQEKVAWTNEIKDLEMTIADLEEGTRKLEDDLTNLREQKSELENQNEKMDRLLTQVEEENYRLKKQYKKTKNSLSEEKKKKNILTKQRRSSLFVNENLERTLGDYKDENLRLKHQRNDLRNKVKKLKEDALNDKRKFNEKLHYMMKQEEELFRSMSPVSGNQLSPSNDELDPDMREY